MACSDAYVHSGQEQWCGTPCTSSCNGGQTAGVPPTYEAGPKPNKYRQTQSIRLKVSRKFALFALVLLYDEICRFPFDVQLIRATTTRLRLAPSTNTYMQISTSAAQSRDESFRLEGHRRETAAENRGDCKHKRNREGAQKSSGR